MENEYTEAIGYTILPSGRLYKVRSLVRIEKMFPIIQPETLCMIFPSLKLIFYRSELIPYFYHTEEIKEIIMGIKENRRIEIDEEVLATLNNQFLPQENNKKK